MPKDRLLAMGLLSKFPAKSTVLDKFVLNSFRKRYTKFELMHMVALFYTPGLPKSWIDYQFQTRGMEPGVGLIRLRRFASRPANKNRWKHLGERNLLFIGQAEVDRYFERCDPKRPNKTTPVWAWNIIRQNLKDGMTQRDAAKKYGIAHSTVKAGIKRSMFEPTRKGEFFKNGGGPRYPSAKQS